mmetsp:Transcript_2796/g.4216  ORF Transcript_2796/g.4216 Transcript_2796/m.4216 type:complete len:608 (+) Transcript_2796:311-2134(+)
MRNQKSKRYKRSSVVLISLFIGVCCALTFYISTHSSLLADENAKYTINIRKIVDVIVEDKFKNESLAVVAVPVEVTQHPMAVKDPRAHALQVLNQHPYFSMIKDHDSVSVEELLVRMHSLEKCRDKPLFISMGKVGSPVYWQLVENFEYTMAKYDLAECSLLVCISDPSCMRRCIDSSFPCINYEDKSSRGKTSTFEQIAKLKLFEIPKAVGRGVPLFIVDLDVGFRQNPMKLVDNFMTGNNDIMVQKDLVFIMNRTKEGWRTWYTRPMPNLGLFMCKGNERVAHMFEVAWNKYTKHTQRLDQPGTDQAIVQSAMWRCTAHNNLTWDFLSDRHVVLMDKIFKFESTTIELGGEITDRLLSNETLDRDTIAVHGTCYELRSKVQALKAAGAFWNPFYYDPARRTLTMRLFYKNKNQLLGEVKALTWLAVATKRTLVVPNVLSDERFSTFLNKTDSGSVLWPGFRVVYTKNSSFPLTIVEPAYYWRIRRDYNISVPEPLILTTTATRAPQILSLLHQYTEHPRIVLNVVTATSSSSPVVAQKLEDKLKSWADGSNDWMPYVEEIEHVAFLKAPNDNIPTLNESVHSTVRLCNKILQIPRGNRSCFDKCK